MPDIGTNIIIMRKQKGWSQTELAKQINCSRANLINYEGNKNTPSIDVASRIADALGVTLDYLVKDGEYEHIDNATLKR